MSAEEFVLIPKNVYTQSQSIAEQVLNTPHIKNKADYLSVLQDYISGSPSEDQLQRARTLAVKPPEVTIEETILEELKLSSLTANQLAKCKFVLQQILDNSRVNVDMSGGLTIDGRAIGVRAVNFLWDLQQPNKKLNKPLLETVLKILLLPEHMVVNKQAKEIATDGWWIKFGAK